MGLSSMRERVGELGGDLVVESVPGQGTTVSAVVPAAGAR
jgi:signal transduction histidine kinase